MYGDQNDTATYVSLILTTPTGDVPLVQVPVDCDEHHEIFHLCLGHLLTVIYHRPGCWQGGQAVDKCRFNGASLFLRISLRSHNPAGRVERRFAGRVGDTEEDRALLLDERVGGFVRSGKPGLWADVGVEMDVRGVEGGSDGAAALSLTTHEDSGTGDELVFTVGDGALSCCVTLRGVDAAAGVATIVAGKPVPGEVAPSSPNVCLSMSPQS